MLWNKYVNYSIILTCCIISFESPRIVYVVEASNNDVVKVSGSEQKQLCHVCKNRTVEEAIKFHKIEEYYEGK